MKVWRIENDEQGGIYNTSPYYWGHVSSRRRPTPYDDWTIWDFIKDRNEYRFGFRGGRQLCKWFGPKCREKAKSLGYKISIYEVDNQHCIASKKQVVFKLDQAKLIERVELKV